jgi:hypothetical protein
MPYSDRKLKSTKKVRTTKKVKKVVLPSQDTVLPTQDVMMVPQVDVPATQIVVTNNGLPIATTPASSQLGHRLKSLAARLGKFITSFAAKLAKDPDLQRHFTSTALNLGKMAYSGSIDIGLITTAAVETAIKVAMVAQKHAVQDGHVTEDDVSNIKKAAGFVQEAVAQRRLMKLPPPTDVQLG